MKNLYSFIGSFYVESGSVLIGDPYINGVTVALEHIPSDNEISISVPNVKPGMYYAHHVIDRIDGALVSLLVSHKDTIIGDLERKKSALIGNITASLGNSVVLVDKNSLFDTNNCYYAFNEKAYYGCDRLLKVIPDMDYPEEMRSELLALTNQTLCDGLPAVAGEKIIEVIGACPICEGFRNFGKDSSLWSVEILEELASSYRNACCIKGGVASLSGVEKPSIYAFSNDSGLVDAFVISLCPE